MLMVLFVTGGYAQAQYLYSHTAKYKVTGENLATGGNFSDGLTGWQNDLGQAASAEYWSIEAGTSPNGGAAAMSMGSGTEGDALYRSWKVDPGTYAVSFYVKAESAGNTTIAEGAANRIDVFVSSTGEFAKGTDAVQAATAESINDQWQQKVFIVTVENGQHVVFAAQHAATGVMISDVAINTVDEVFDTRIAERYISYVEQLIADENLPNGKDDLTGAVEGVLKTELLDPTKNEDKSSMQSLLEMFENDILVPFFNANGANLFPTYLKDWNSWGKYNYAKLSTKDNWTFEGGRWGFTGNEDYLEFKAGDGYIASAGIQTSMNLNAGIRTKAGALDALPAGKYFFSIEAQAVAASNRANPYGADHNVVIDNPYFFIGKDTIVIADTLSGYHWKRYYAIAEIKDGTEKVVGFHFPYFENKKGGRYSLRNPQVYLLGNSTEDMEFKARKEAFIVQQVNLNKRITEYPVELAAANYPWEQDSLARAIAIAQPVYEASLLIIDAEGNVLDKDQVTEEYTQLLLDQVNALGRARNFVISQNAPIATLKETVTAANAALTDPANAGASAAKRTALQNAVNAGQALIDGISATNQGDAFTAAVADILAAMEEFKSTTANRANPTEILIKNADFSDFAAGNNITSFENPTKDWNWRVYASANRWEIRDNETLSQGHGASIWRGTTVQLDGKAWQTVDLTYEGLYEYRAEAYISEERLAELVAASEIIYNESEQAVDTIFTPNIRLFFGNEGAPDSITISKWYNGVKNDGTYFTRDVSGAKYGGMVYATYSVFFKKSGAAPVTVEFGLEAADNFATAGANGFGFGNNKVYYLGDEAQYLADTKADLTAAVAAAKTLAANNPDSYWTVKLNRYIKNAEEATTAKQMQNALWGINEVSSRLQGTATGIEAVTTNTNTVAAAKGVYTLTGIKVADKADNLKPGFYIINGKKHVIK